nr:stage II sporulation protein R [Clostridia bacterium]
MTGFIQRFTVTFSILLILGVILGAFVPINGESVVYTDTLRLHVLANSDSAEDQALKLKVR